MNLEGADIVANGSYELKIYLWVDGGDVVVSLVELWLAVGAYDAAGFKEVLSVNHCGLAQLGRTTLK